MADKTMPAFPGNSEQTGPWFGMSLRAYFASKNVAAMVSTIHNDDDYLRARHTADNLGHKTVSEWFAYDAVRQADALIAELDK